MRSPLLCTAVLALAACGGSDKMFDPGVTNPAPPAGLVSESIPFDAVGPNRIVFHRDIPGVGSGLVMIDGSAKTVTTTYSHAGRELALSPDGTRIVYLAAPPISEEKQRFAEVYVRSWSGQDGVPIAGTGGRRSIPSWTPDGAKIVFAEGDTYGTTPFPRIVSQSPVANATDQKILWSAKGCETGDAPVMNASGDIAFIYSGASSCALTTDIATVSASGAFNVVYDNPSAGASVRPPAWSPDGKQIAFLQSDFTSAQPGFGQVAMDVVIILADGTKPRTYLLPITETAAFYASPSLCWSRDNSRLFISMGVSNTVGHVYSMLADGTGFTQITSAPAADGWVACG